MAEECYLCEGDHYAGDCDNASGEPVPPDAEPMCMTPGCEFIAIIGGILCGGHHTDILAGALQHSDEIKSLTDQVAAHHAPTEDLYIEEDDGLIECQVCGADLTAQGESDDQS